MKTMATAGIIRPEWQTVKIKYSYVEFEARALSDGVWPDQVAALWNKFKADAEIAATRIAREVMNAAIQTYLMQKNTDGLNDWLNTISVNEP
jgi:hypothetical protein